MAEDRDRKQVTKDMSEIRHLDKAKDWPESDAVIHFPRQRGVVDTCELCFAILAVESNVIATVAAIVGKLGWHVICDDCFEQLPLPARPDQLLRGEEYRP